MIHITITNTKGENIVIIVTTEKAKKLLTTIKSDSEISKSNVIIDSFIKTLD